MSERTWFFFGLAATVPLSIIANLATSRLQSYMVKRKIIGLSRFKNKEIENFKFAISLSSNSKFFVFSLIHRSTIFISSCISSLVFILVSILITPDDYKYNLIPDLNLPLYKNISFCAAFLMAITGFLLVIISIMSYKRFLSIAFNSLDMSKYKEELVKRFGDDPDVLALNG